MMKLLFILLCLFIYNNYDAIHLLTSPSFTWLIILLFKAYGAQKAACHFDMEG